IATTRHDAGGELDTCPRQLQRAAQGADEERRGDPRHPFEEHVPLAEEPDDETRDRRVLPHDRLTDFVSYPCEGVPRGRRCGSGHNCSTSSSSASSDRARAWSECASFGGGPYSRASTSAAGRPAARATCAVTSPAAA